MPPLHNGVNAVTGIAVGPVKVELAGVAKFTWNLKRLRLFVPKNTRKFGDPAGGAVVPSRSAGSRPPTDEPCWKQTWVAGCPLSMALRS